MILYPSLPRKQTLYSPASTNASEHSGSALRSSGGQDASHEHAQLVPRRGCFQQRPNPDLHCAGCGLPLKLTAPVQPWSLERPADRGKPRGPAVIGPWCLAWLGRFSHRSRRTRSELSSELWIRERFCRAPGPLPYDPREEGRLPPKDTSLGARRPTEGLHGTASEDDYRVHRSDG